MRSADDPRSRLTSNRSNASSNERRDGEQLSVGGRETKSADDGGGEQGDGVDRDEETDVDADLEVGLVVAQSLPDILHLEGLVEAHGVFLKHMNDNGTLSLVQESCGLGVLSLVSTMGSKRRTGELTSCMQKKAATATRTVAIPSRQN
jgi:hypothetical protein